MGNTIHTTQKGGAMNIKEIKEMINVMKENDINEFEMEKDGFKIKLKKCGHVTVAQESVVMQPQPIAQMTPATAPAEAAPAAQPADDPNVETIRSPMVGTFYKAPAPDADPFVTTGQKVSSGDTLCIIEAMKLMNEIKAEMAGTIVEVLVENGQAVEFDQPLFKIKK